jgi:hypothetical protein
MNRKAVWFLILVMTSCRSTSTLTTNLVSESSWVTGHDSATTQLIPVYGTNPIVRGNGEAMVHIKFSVKQYGEVSFPINSVTAEGAEALRADLSKSKGIQITYQSNNEFIMQLRQTGVHGGVHNHVVLPSSKRDTTITMSFNEFKGGRTPLDLTNVAKFNFAFLSNPGEECAELKIKRFTINKYKP